MPHFPQAPKPLQLFFLFKLQLEAAGTPSSQDSSPGMALTHGATYEARDTEGPSSIFSTSKKCSGPAQGPLAAPSSLSLSPTPTGRYPSTTDDDRLVPVPAPHSTHRPRCSQQPPQQPPQQAGQIMPVE